jgi:hypothetical protein
MSEPREAELFPVAESEHSTGLLPSQLLRGAIASVPAPYPHPSWLRKLWGTRVSHFP